MIVTPRNTIITPDNKIMTQGSLLGSFLNFTRVFYELRTGREFSLSFPISRESHFITISKVLTDVFNGNIKKVYINIPPRYGKAIDVSTPVLTSTGWKIAKEISLGDYVLGSKKFVKVTGVFNQGKISAKCVKFSDGQSVICNNEHLWAVYDRYSSKQKIRTTKELIMRLYEGDGRKNWKIPLTTGEYGYVTPTISPYLFGCWLGDGSSYYSAITTMDKEIVNAFIKNGHIMKPHTHQSGGKAITYGIIKNNFQKTLRLYNQLGNKHIPDEVYLWNKKDRYELLQGLMDTDGTCGKNGQVSFTNTNNSILDGTRFLVVSLGGVFREYKRKSGIITLNIRMPTELNPFKLKRKKKLVSSGNKCIPRRYISSIEDEKSKEMVCFTVDAKDQLFCVGRGLILTHNTELLIHFVAWALARYAMSNFLYISYSHTLARKQTRTIRDIINMPIYRRLFDVSISKKTHAQDDFETTDGGSIYAAGAGGTITGRGAGVKGLDHFSGCIIIDDIHKPDEALSDVIREGIIDWFYNTMQSRVNTRDTPIIYIGQRVHENDLIGNFEEKEGWHRVVLPSLDGAGNALYPEMHPKEDLLVMKEEQPYVFSAQYQQEPIPAGGTVFSDKDFMILEDEPEIMSTFLTVDTAETDKDYNDKTVFSFWGVYNIKINSASTNLFGIHWLDCIQLQIEPNELENELFSFYSDCLRHKIKAEFVAIEKKSTGTTLVSVLKKIPGLKTMEIERTKASGSKAQRYLEMQPYIRRKQVSFTMGAKHIKMCIEHMSKITLNDSHRWDDIADTAYDGVKLALIDGKLIMFNDLNKAKREETAANIMSGFRQKQQSNNLFK